MAYIWDKKNKLMVEDVFYLKFSVADMKSGTLLKELIHNTFTPPEQEQQSYICSLSLYFRKYLQEC